MKICVLSCVATVLQHNGLLYRRPQFQHAAVSTERSGNATSWKYQLSWLPKSVSVLLKQKEDVPAIVTILINFTIWFLWKYVFWAALQLCCNAHNGLMYRGPNFNTLFIQQKDLEMPPHGYISPHHMAAPISVCSPQAKGGSARRKPPWCVSRNWTRSHRWGEGWFVNSLTRKWQKNWLLASSI